MILLSEQKVGAKSQQDPSSSVGFSQQRQPMLAATSQTFFQQTNQGFGTTNLEGLDAEQLTERLLVAEMLTVPGEPNPGIAVLDMMMMLYFGEARPRTVDEYQALFRATRLDLTRARQPAG